MKEYEMVQHVTRKQTWAGGKIIQTDVGLLADKMWKAQLINYPTELLSLIRKSLMEKVPDLSEKFNQAGLYFGYRVGNRKDKAYIYVQKKNLVIDLCISRNFTTELKKHGFGVKYRDNFQGRADWLTGWRIPQSTLNPKPAVKWLCKALKK